MSEGRVAKLQVLAARVVQEALAKKLEGVVEEEEAAFESAFTELEERKAARIRARQDELLRTSGDAIHLQELVGSYFDFCDECNTFFEIDTDPRCSIEGCSMHKVCLCQLDAVLDRGHHFYDSFRGKSISVAEEQPNWNVHNRAEVDCWICDETFCKSHFFEHYEVCREKVSFCCGFRPASQLYQHPYRRVLGHCGNDVRASDEYHFCEHWNHDDNEFAQDEYDQVQCGTLFCGNCAQYCYYGCAGHCQLCYSSRCSSDEDD